MISTRMESGLGHGRAGLRIALGALGMVGIMAISVLSALGSAAPSSPQAGVSERGDAAYSLAGISPPISTWRNNVKNWKVT